jgi:serine/threonine protein kinase
MSVVGEDRQGRRRVFDTPDTPIPARRPDRPQRIPLGDLSPGHGFRTKPERPAKNTPNPASGRPNFSIEGYEIMECRGKGGMGQVYRAVQKSLGREVAIKTLDLSLARHQASIMRFTKEAAAMAHLRHPNIVQVIDRGSSRQRHYFVMEFVDGPSLRELLREGAFAPQEALQIMLQLARTMAYAHKQGVIHRDLKPENILYTSDGVLKVADFGLAGVEHETTYIRKLTRSFVSMGTECYMAPEQRRDAKNVDFRADLYSMGVIFYELLTNQLPFPQMPPPHRVIAHGHPEVDVIIRRCLAPEIEERYTSTEALVQALDDALNGCNEEASKVQEPVDVHRDTVIDTPGIQKQLAPEEPDAFEARLSGWSGRVKSAISDASDHVSMSWQHGNLRRWMVTGVSLLALVAVVGLFFMFSPKPPAPNTTPQERMEMVWKAPAKVKQLAGKRQALGFLFDANKLLASSWSRRPRMQWELKGNWVAKGKQIEQNTYKRSVILNHRDCWALYRGHKLTGNPIQVDVDVFMRSPVVPHKNGSLVPLQDYIRREMPALRTARMRPKMGIGLKGPKGQRISFILKQKGNRLAYTFLVRHAPGRGSKNSRVEAGVLSAHFAYNRSFHVSLVATAGQASVSVDGKHIETIKFTKKQEWSSNAGLVCRDGHCVFRNFQLQAIAKDGLK